MCGRFYVDDELEHELEKVIRMVSDQMKPSSKGGDVKPSQAALVLRKEETKLLGEQMQWGFQKFDNKGLVINARAEDITTKPMFREGIRSCRCIIPARKYYEWDAYKDKVTFFRPDHSILYFAGIYQPTKDVNRFVIMTTKANASVQTVHDRMPLILQSNEISDWIYNEKRVEELLHKEPESLEQSRDYEQQTLQLS